MLEKWENLSKYKLNIKSNLIDNTSYIGQKFVHPMQCPTTDDLWTKYYKKAKLKKIGKTNIM